jgi:hypothetical protein
MPTNRYENRCKTEQTLFTSIVGKYIWTKLPSLHVYACAVGFNISFASSSVCRNFRFHHNVPVRCMQHNIQHKSMCQTQQCSFREETCNSDTSITPKEHGSIIRVQSTSHILRFFGVRKLDTNSKFMSASITMSMHMAVSTCVRMRSHACVLVWVSLYLFCLCVCARV